MEEKIFITREHQQRLYAIVAVMAKDLAWDRTSLMAQLKESFREVWGYGDRELSTALTKMQVKEFEVFKDYVLDIAMDQGVTFPEIPGIFYDDLEQYTAMCIKHYQCCVTQRKNDPLNGHAVHIHHSDKIGMGNDRTKVDHSKLRRMPLLAEYHQECHTIGEQAFQDKYHIVPVKTMYRCGPEYDDILDKKEQEAKENLGNFLDD